MKPMTLVRIKENGFLGITRDVCVSKNGSVSFAIHYINGDGGKVAWFNVQEVEVIANLAEAMIDMMSDDRCSPSKFDLMLRRE